MKKSTGHDGPDGALSQMPKFGMRWYQYNPAFHLAATLKMSAEEKANYYDTLNTALVMERRGLNPEADKMMDNADHVSEVRRKAAERSWESRRDDANAKQMQNICNALPTDLPNRPTEPDLSTEPRPKPKEPEQSRVGNLGFSIGKIIGGCGVDKYEKIMGLVGEDAIANFTADFCADTDRPRAIGGYKKAMRLIGTEGFKSELCRFLGAVDAGEDPPNRGGTFYKHYLKPAMEAKAKR